MYCIVGADGFLGSEFLSLALRLTDEKILALNHVGGIYPDSDRLRNMNFELSDPASADRAVEALSSGRDIRLLHLACVHHPDEIKRDPELAGYVNTVCYGAFLDRLAGLDISRFIYASSDTVYGENRFGRPFVESDPLEPVNIYGKQKKDAEGITLAHGYSVARLPYMSGPSATPRKEHFFDQLVRDLTQGRPIYMFTDYVRSCISYAQAAELLFGVFGSGAPVRIVNVCADEPTSKYDIGLLIADFCGAPRELVRPCLSGDLGIFDEYRANVLTMDNSLMKSILGRDDGIALAYERKNRNG